MSMYTLLIIDRSGRQIERHSIEANLPRMHERLTFDPKRVGVVAAVNHDINLHEGRESDVVVTVMLDVTPPALRESVGAE